MAHTEFDTDNYSEGLDLCLKMYSWFFVHIHSSLPSDMTDSIALLEIHFALPEEKGLIT